jgi:hypothetical protein
LTREHVKRLHDIYPQRAKARIQKLSQNVGNMNPESLILTGAILDHLEGKKEFTRDVVQAQALIYAFILYESSGETYPSPYGEYLKAHIEPYIFDEIFKILPSISQTNKMERITLIEMSFPALKNMSKSQYDHFKSTLSGVIQSDQKIHLFEFCVTQLVLHYLNQYYVPKENVRPTKNLKGVLGDMELIVSALSHYGTKNDSEAQLCMDRALAMVPNAAFKLIPLDAISFSKIAEALRSLQMARSGVRQQLIDACGACVSYDGKIDLEEYELSRTVAALLDCPLPLMKLESRNRPQIEQPIQQR